MTALTLTGFKGAVSGKVTGLVLGTVAAISGFNLMERLTGNNGLSIAFSAACLVVVTIIKTRPKIIEAETGRDSASRSQALKEWTELLGQIHQQHSLETNALLKRIEQQNKMTNLLPIIIHELSGQLGAAEIAVRVRGESLRGHGIEVVPYTPRDIRLLTRAADEIRANIVGIELPDISEIPNLDSI